MTLAKQFVLTLKIREKPQKLDQQKFYTNQYRAALWRIFSSNKSMPANRNKRFYANHDPNKQNVGFIFPWSGSELWTLLKYSRSKLKNQKHIAVDVLLKAHPMIPLSSWSNLAGWYL
jgi:hypothetical protein